MRYTYRIETIGADGLKLAGVPQLTTVYYLIHPIGGRKIGMFFREADADDIVTKLNYCHQDNSDDASTGRFE